MLTIPANAAGPVPVIMEFGLSAEALAAIRRSASPTPNGPISREQDRIGSSSLLAQGLGLRRCSIPTSMQADNGAGLTQGIIGLVNKGQPRKLDDWGALRAWAWGASRALDYFETDKSVDAKQRRHRRTVALWQGGIGRHGLRPALRHRLHRLLRRRRRQDCTAAISASRSRTSPRPREYHWMAGNFLKYAGPLTPNDLPVDSHELIALCAPRPVFISSRLAAGRGRLGRCERHVPGGVGAGPVYRLLGKKDLGTTEFPPMETAADRRRYRLPPAQRRAYTGSELADVPDLRRAAIYKLLRLNDRHVWHSDFC